MNKQPAFKLGDKVVTKSIDRFGGDTGGVVTGITTRYLYYVSGQGLIDEGDLVPAKLSESEAWVEATLLIATIIANNLSYDSDDDKETRHQAYRLLGGNGIKVTPEVKARVQEIISRLAVL